MKKQLVLTKIENDYKLTMKDQEKNFIIIKNKVINGEELYTAFYAGVTEEIKFVVETELSDSKDTIIYNQLCELFKKIDSEVNENCFNKRKGED